jgi:hypothetical protein
MIVDLGFRGAQGFEHRCRRTFRFLADGCLADDCENLFQPAAMFKLMLMWRGSPRPEGLTTGLAVIVFFQFDRLVLMIVALVVPMAMFMIPGMVLLRPKYFSRQLHFAVNVDVQLGSHDAATADPRNLKSRSNIQRRDCILEQLRRNSGIQQGAQKHVAANAGKAVEVGYAHKDQCCSFVVGQTL